MNQLTKVSFVLSGVLVGIGRVPTSVPGGIDRLVGLTVPPSASKLMVILAVSSHLA